MIIIQTTYEIIGKKYDYKYNNTVTGELYYRYMLEGELELVNLSHLNEVDLNNYIVVVG